MACHCSHMSAGSGSRAVQFHMANPRLHGCYLHHCKKTQKSPRQLSAINRIHFPYRLRRTLSNSVNLLQTSSPLSICQLDLSNMTRKDTYNRIGRTCKPSSHCALVVGTSHRLPQSDSHRPETHMRCIAPLQKATSVFETKQKSSKWAYGRRHEMARSVLSFLSFPDHVSTLSYRGGGGFWQVRNLERRNVAQQNCTTFCRGT